MNSVLASWLSLPAAAAGAAALVVGPVQGIPDAVRIAAGAIGLAAGAACIAVADSGRRRAAARFRAWCADDAADVAAPPLLEPPFAEFAAAACDRFRRQAAAIGARAAEARRSKVAARSLQQEHGVLASLLDNLSDGVLVCEASGVATGANRAARTMLGLGAGDPLKRPLSELPIRAALRAPLENALRQDSAECRRTQDVDCSDSEQRLIVRLSFRDVVAGSDDGAGGVAVLLRDVTREVELTRMKSDFASSVSHELKTPLCSMRAFLEMLIDGDIEGEDAQREHLGLVLNETDRLARLVQNLLNLSRLEAGITRMDRKPVALAELLSHLRDVVTPLAAARQQTIVFDISEFLPLVTGDSNLLEQCVMNLVSNAIKYTPEGGSVRVAAALNGSQVEIRVADTGVGIPEKALELIFERFTRIENNAGLKATGTGLGLPLAKFVAEAHGGQITVRSEVGQGSEFRLLLPARRGGALSGPDGAEEQQLVGLEGITG